MNYIASLGVNRYKIAEALALSAQDCKYSLSSLPFPDIQKKTPEIAGTRRDCPYNYPSKLDSSTRSGGLT